MKKCVQILCNRQINFINGFVNTDMHPVELYEKTLNGMWDSFREDRDNIMKTFDYSRNLGDEFFREQLSELYHRLFGRRVSADSFLVQNGVRDLMMFLTTVFLHDFDKYIVVEDPTFYLICGCLQQSGYKILRCPLDENGLCLTSLQKLLDEYDISAVYTIPMFQNPTGLSLSTQRKNELIRMSQEHDFLIFSDEVYSFLNYSDDEHIPMSYLDDCKDGGSVISLNSVSKILSPGIRLGWAQVNEDSSLLKIFEEDSGWAYSSGSGCQFLATMVGKSIESGDFEDHLRKVNHTYGERMDTLCSILKQSDHIEVFHPKGGYFVWTKYDDDDSKIDQIVERCGERDVVVKKYEEDFPGELGMLSRPNIRMSVGFMSNEEIKEGAEIFVEVVDEIFVS